jgi:hypothetical protein
MKRKVVAASFCALFLAGCAVDKYQAATPQFAGTPAPHQEAAVVVLLKPVFPRAPFSEIVCDNTVGVMWSPEESQHIGFTQRYARTLMQNGPQLAMLAALPVNQRIGMQASGNAQALNIDSRILVPFGRYITDNLKQAISSGGTVCEDEECVSQAAHRYAAPRRVVLEFTKFRVAEDERNTLTLEVEGVATVYRSDAATVTAPIHHLIKNRSITSEGMWHSDILKAMNKIANESSSAVAAQIEAAGQTL